MVICHNKKCIFIHIPKTAGTSIEQFLKENGKNDLQLLGVHNNRSMQHYMGIELKKMYPLYYKNYFKFSVVRNPYDRLLSEYYWTPVPNMGFKYGKTRAYFLYCVQNIVKKRQFFNNIYFDHLIPQYMFLYENKKLIVDKVIKYENLQEDSKILKNELNISNDLLYLNKSNIKKEGWTELQKEKIYKLYLSDFLLFNYEK
jgi:hypothetical protein